MKRVSLVPVLAALLAGCAGPPVPSSLEGEPICPDFEIGATRAKMEGGLRQPISLTVKDDDDNVVFRATIRGRRDESASRVRTAFSDDDAELTVEWAQCANERAPEPVESAAKPKGATAYECGEAKVYLTAPLVTKKGDPKSHVLTVPQPPNAACWAPETPPVVPPAPTASAPPPEPTPSASASAAAAPSASAAPVSTAHPSTPKGDPKPSKGASSHPKDDVEGAVIQE